MRKKIYCKDCKHCGDIINYYPNNPYPVGEEPWRYCNSPEAIRVVAPIKVDTYYQYYEYVPIPSAIDFNRKNDCIYFEEK